MESSTYNSRGEMINLLYISVPKERERIARIKKRDWKKKKKKKRNIQRGKQEIKFTCRRGFEVRRTESCPFCCAQVKIKTFLFHNQCSPFSSETRRINNDDKN